MNLDVTSSLFNNINNLQNGHQVITLQQINRERKGGGEEKELE